MQSRTQNRPPRLSAHSDGYLVAPEGMPFFYLADTVWMAFANLTLDAWARYLAYRRVQGFNALQISILPVTHDTSWGPENMAPFRADADGNEFVHAECGGSPAMEKVLVALARE